MAAEVDDDLKDIQEPVTPKRSNAQSASGNSVESSEQQDAPKSTDGAGDSSDEDEEADDEPKLKYHRLTPNLSSVYRSGDATSCFLVSGDKMILGTHNGNIGVLSLPTFQPLRLYHAHSATITAISVSPFPIPFSTRQDLLRPPLESETPTSSPSPAHTAQSPRTPRQPALSPSPSNSIYIATSSIDGHVCVSSLLDPKDVTLRNFARPISAVALSPEYKSDRTYISGGKAGNLVLTIGGKSGVSSNANTNSAAAAASGWLSSIGLGTNTGRDTILHSGEGSISMIKWSFTGKFVVWANEQGIKIMRTNLHLESGDADYAWTRIAHIDRPSRSQWDEMAGVWKARAEWINDSHLETDEDESTTNGQQSTHSTPAPGIASVNKHNRSTKRKSEKLVVGWGDSVWVLQVKAESRTTGKDGPAKHAGSASIIHHLLFDDCIISGVTLYTPSLLLILAYRTKDDDDKPVPTTMENTPRRGVHHRQTGLSPELRLINVSTKEEVDVDTLTVSRYEGLSAADYHLGTLYVPAIAISTTTTKSAFEAISGGLWDVTAGATRIFSSAASIRSGTGSSETAVTSPRLKPLSSITGTPTSKKAPESIPAVNTPGLKIFIQSPYDCVLALKRDLSDHLTWLIDHEQYKEAWGLVQDYPEAIVAVGEELSTDDAHSTPTKHSRQSLKDFFEDDAASHTTVSASKVRKGVVETERRRIGELWLQKLVSAKEWSLAGQVAGKVLGQSPKWEHWIWTFAQASRFDEITPYIPTKQIHPPLPSVVYERVLGHYLMRSIPRFKELIEAWEVDLFHIESVTSAIENKLKNGDVREDTVEDGIQGRDWRILLESLAKLQLADGRPKETLKCYIKLQNSDAAMSLIGEYHLVEAIADDIVGFLTLRVPKDSLANASLPELEDASNDAIRLLVDEGLTGVVKPQMVIDQLIEAGVKLRPFLFFYLRSLWKGQTAERRPQRVHQRLETEGRQYVEEYGDLAVSLFAEYDRLLLIQFLKGSRSYSYEKATALCEQKHFYPELVHLLSQTGQLKRALSLIINSLGDVKFAIQFAKEQNDAELWDDLLEFSMDKPSFIRGLLEEVGTSIDPIKLVRRIPEGLEIEGLREGVGRMLREYEIQGSISEGVARVLRGEVAAGMDTLREGRAKGIKFNILDEKVIEDMTTDNEKSGDQNKVAVKAEESHDSQTNAEPGHCIQCRRAFSLDDKETLIGFACGHIYHLSCIIATIEDPAIKLTAEKLRDQLAADADDSSDTRSVGAKVTHAHILKNIVGRGCPLCHLIVDD